MLPQPQTGWDSDENMSKVDEIDEMMRFLCFIHFRIL